MKKTYSILTVIMVFSLVSCNSLLEGVLPDNVIEKEDAIESYDDLQELLNSSYDVFANSNNGNNQRFSELLADNVNIIGNSGNLVQVYNRSSDFFNSDIGGYYIEQYRPIFRANSVLESMSLISLTEDQAKRFEGEAKFIRAISHFELVRLFAQPYGYTPDNSHLGIVIKTSTDISPLNRSTVAQVYAQIIADLKDAETLLDGVEDNDNYATKYSAKAYLAKVYFQMNDFTNAAAYAQEVVDELPFSTDINNRFTKELSPEAAFGIVSTTVNDNRGSMLRDSYRSINAGEDPDDTETINPPLLRSSNEYFNFMTSDTDDLRSEWVAEKTYTTGDAFVITKFDSTWFSVTLASVTELKLIAAESYAELNTNLAVAQGHLNDIKGRAEVPLLTGATASTLITEARIERRKEFAGEGHRLHELKRLGVLGEDILVRGAPWDCNGMVLQFPASERSIEGFVSNPQGGCN